MEFCCKYVGIFSGDSHRLELLLFFCTVLAALGWLLVLNANPSAQAYSPVFLPF